MANNSDLQKQRIMEATKKIIAEQGYRKLTLRQVAAETGISPGTLYYYYKSKNLILYDIADQSAREAVNLANHMKSNPWTQKEIFTRLLKIIYGQIRNNDGNKLFLHLMYEALSGDEEELAAKLREKYESWINSFEDIIVMYFGITKGPMSRALAAILDSMIDGLTWKQLLGMKTVEDPAIDEFFKLCFGGRLEELMCDIREGTIQSGNLDIDDKDN